MPLLKGGIKYRKKIKPKGTRVAAVRRGRIISRKDNSEGIVYEAEVELASKKGRKVLEMVEKEFFNPDITITSITRRPAQVHSGIKHPFWRVVSQFNIMNKLASLNKAKKLGLRIVPTVRLLKVRGKKPTLVMTRLKNLKNPPNLSSKEDAEFERDVERQMSILSREGSESAWDCFFPQIDKNGKCMAILGDFGHVKPLKRKP